MHGLSEDDQHRIESALADWRAQFERAGLLPAEILDEAEDHLRSSIAAAFDRHGDVRLAVKSALQTFGPTPLLLREHALNQPAMTFLPRLLGTAFLLSVLGLALEGAGGLGLFLHVPALLFVVGLVVGGLWAGFGVTPVLHALRATLCSRTRLAPLEQDLASAVYERGYRLAWAAGVLGFLVGTVALLSNLGDPSELGQGLALSVLSLFYGGVLAELGFRSLRQWAASPASAPGADPA